MEPAAIKSIAEEFWAAVGESEPFPRQLETSVLWVLPLAVFKLPRLWVSDVEDWLAGRGISFRLETGDRPLHGCLLAYAGRGCVLLNGADGSAELRFSLAHEAAHFLLDYLQPRQRAVNQLGHGIIEVLDGRRLPTIQERVHAILSYVPIGFHTHLMERRNNDVMDCGAIYELENSADLLALELLAPEAEVRRRVAQGGHDTAPENRGEMASRMLEADFGLPAAVAASYARFLYPRVHSYSVREWLRQLGE